MGIPAIQLVGPEMSKEELLELYLEVYKLNDFQGLLLGNQYYLKRCCPPSKTTKGVRRKRHLQPWQGPVPKTPHSSRSGFSQKGKRDSSVERSLATVHEAHQKVLAMAATLEEEIERLNCTKNYSEPRAISKSRDCQGQSRKEQKRRCCQVQFEDPPAPSHPADSKMGSSEEGTTSKGSDLEEPLELGLVVASFLRGLPGTSKDEGDRMPPEPVVLEFSQWVPWKTKKCETPNWWTKLSMVPGIEDCRKLA